MASQCTRLSQGFTWKYALYRCIASPYRGRSKGQGNDNNPTDIICSPLDIAPPRWLPEYTASLSDSLRVMPREDLESILAKNVLHSKLYITTGLSVPPEARDSV